MPRLHVISNFLTRKYFKAVKNEFKRVGVKMSGNKIKGLLFFVSARQLNTLQIIFLDARIALIVSNFLAQYGAQLRNEFLEENSYPHSTIFNKKQFGDLPLKYQEMVASKYQEEAVEVEMVGLVALTNGDEVLLGIEIKSPEADHIRQLVGYRATIYPHITTSHMWKHVYHRNLEPTVGRIVGIVDVYYGFWEEVRKEKIKTWVERESDKRKEYHLRTRHSVVDQQARDSEVDQRARHSVVNQQVRHSREVDQRARHSVVNHQASHSEVDQGTRHSVVNHRASHGKVDHQARDSKVDQRARHSVVDQFARLNLVVGHGYGPHVGKKQQSVGGSRSI